jgi:DNA-binding CsgD family transcriptional regulator
VLFGRDKEREALDRLLTTAGDGVGGSLVLRGEPGVGKTALLEYAIEHAIGLQTVRVAGIESEMELGFAALHRLLIPRLPRVDRLPEPQREALRRVLGLATGAAPDRFLVGLALWTLLADAAKDHPLLVVVDDAHWLDGSSAQVLAFVARRLRSERIAFVIAVREPAPRGPSLDGLPDLHVADLAAHQARGLLASVVTGPLDDRIADRIVAEAGGNPLALIALGMELAEDRLASGTPLPRPLPITHQLTERFLRQVRTLPASTQTLMLLAAAEPSRDAALVSRAAERLKIAKEAVVPAEAGGLLAVGEQIGFRHPLGRSAVYHAAPHRERRRIHKALAAAVDPRADPDGRAWHLAEAAAGPDEQVATGLVASADRARGRGAHAAEAALLARAADLTPDQDRRASRLVDAAWAGLTAGAPAQAQALLEQVAPWRTGPLPRARALHLQGALRMAQARFGEAPPILLRAAGELEQLDAGLARDTLLDAVHAAFLAGRFAGSGGLADVARAAHASRTAAHSPRTTGALLLDGFTTRATVGYPAAVPLLREAVTGLLAEPPGADPLRRLLAVGCWAAWDLLDDEAQHAMASRWVGADRDQAALGTLPTALTFLARSELLAGRFEEAAAYLDEARQLAASSGVPGIGYAPGLGDLLVLAWRGREAEARAAATERTRSSIRQGLGAGVSVAQSALAILELGLGRYEAALACALNVYRDDPPDLGTHVLPDLVEAAARTREPGIARSALDRLSERALASGTELALGLLARSRALLADDGEAEGFYLEVTAHLHRSSARPHVARAHLLYGEWLRRQRRRRDARMQLRIAHEMFDAMGMDAFAGRARVELHATGERVSKRTDGAGDALTAQERRIALLVAEGFSNRHVAEQMFVSPNTVEYHLQKVFRKLGVSSRTQIARALPAPEETIRPA